MGGGLLRGASPRRDLSRRFVAATGTLTLVFFIWQVVWAILTPAFRAPDEPVHVNSVIRVVEGGGWPAPGEGRVSSSVLQAVRESGMISADSQSFTALDRTRVVGSREEYPEIPSFSETVVTPHSQRISLNGEGPSLSTDSGSGDDNASGVDTAPDGDDAFGGDDASSGGDGTDRNGGATEIVDQMTQHPPLFYVLQAVAYRAVGAADWQWDRQLLFMRVVSALMTLPLVPCAVYAARRAGTSRRMALTAGVFVFAIPQLAYVTGSLNNDALAIGAGALCLAAASAAMFGSGGWRTVWAAGLALGLGLWSKGTFIPMGLTVGLAFLANVNGMAWRQRWLRAVCAGGIGVVTGGFWWARNVLLYGVLQPAGYQSAFLAPGSDVSEFLTTAFRNLVQSFWGRFDWMDWLLTAPLVWVLTAGACVTVIVAVFGGPHRIQRLVLICFFVSVTAMLLAQAWTQYREGGIVPGTQGRYLFPGVVGLLTVWVLGVGRIGGWMSRVVPARDRLSGRPLFSRPIPLLVTIPAVLVAAYSALTWAQACYPLLAGGSSDVSTAVVGAHEGGIFEALGTSVSVDVQRWSLVAGLNSGVLEAVVVLGACALLIAALIPLVVSNRPEPVAATQPEPEAADQPELMAHIRSELVAANQSESRWPGTSLKAPY